MSLSQDWLRAGISIVNLDPSPAPSRLFLHHSAEIGTRFHRTPAPSGFKFQASNERHLPEIWEVKDKDKPLISRGSYVHTCRLVSEVTLEVNFSLT